MALEKITEVKGTAVNVPGDDIDTDRIIPARYMKCVTFDGLGEYMFYDVRLDENGNKKDHPLNDFKFEGASILISGNNFGCGSSREHAPQAIYRAGFRAILAEGFAEIFFGNSTTLGMPCVVLGKSDLEAISQKIESEPKVEVGINIESKKVSVGGESYGFEMRETAREALLSGQWDPISNLLEGLPDVEKTAGQLFYMEK